MSHTRKALLMAAGILSVGLAAAGIVLPLLPTTPFLLLAAACFLRSSDRLHRWLITHRWFGPYIRNYREHGAVTRRAKSGTLILLWATLGYTAYGLAQALWLRLLLALVGIGVTAHVLRLRTMTPRRNSGTGGRTDKSCRGA
ncbi:MAG: DUF454 domain-containing protein [Acidobacteria bacterium]|nr:DUF454 domain-containing protein [Acidobacteriota bacterium]